MAKFNWRGKRYDSVPLITYCDDCGRGIDAEVRFTFHDIGTVTATLYGMDGNFERVVANGYGRSKEEALFNLLMRWGYDVGEG